MSGLKVLSRPFNLEFKEALLNLEFDESPLLLKEGLRYLDLAGWYEYLCDIPTLQPDSRHFSVDCELHIKKWWEISYQPEKAHVYAHSNTRQPLHNDNAWFADGAEVNFFAMERQARAGGAQIIYPVSRLMTDLASAQPELLRDLCDCEVVISKGADGGAHRTSVIREGEKTRCYWNFYRIDKTDANIMKMCEAFFLFLERQETSSSVIRVFCDTNDCLVFNDTLLLHGRESFEAKNAYDRILHQSMWKFTAASSL